MKSRILVILSLASFITYTALVDYETGLTVYWAFWCMSVLVAGVVVFFTRRLSGRRYFLFYIIVYFSFLLVLAVVKTSPVKQFRLFFQHIRPEMSNSEVLNTLQLYFPIGGKYRQPVVSGDDRDTMVVTLDPQDWRYNSEMIYIIFQDHRVRGKGYYPD